MGLGREKIKFYFMDINIGVIRRPGYYVCTSSKVGRKRLHVAMWEQAAGREVPAGCVVHHLDWDKSNNTVENLVCLTVSEHERIHNISGKDLGYKIKAERGLDAPPGL